MLFISVLLCKSFAIFHHAAMRPIITNEPNGQMWLFDVSTCIDGASISLIIAFDLCAHL